MTQRQSTQESLLITLEIQVVTESITRQQFYPHRCARRTADKAAVRLAVTATWGKLITTFSRSKNPCIGMMGALSAHCCLILSTVVTSGSRYNVQISTYRADRDRISTDHMFRGQMRHISTTRSTSLSRLLRDPWKCRHMSTFFEIIMKKCEWRATDDGNMTHLVCKHVLTP